MGGEQRKLKKTFPRNETVHICLSRLYLTSKFNNTFEDGSELPAREWSRAAVLSESQLHIEQWNADKDQHDGVRYEKRSAAVTIAQVREPPHVAQTHRIAAPHVDNKSK